MTDAEIIDFLKQHPEFLSQHPELLEQLSIPHQQGSAASLIEHQVEVLRNRNRELQRKLNRYLDNASDNEALLQKIHQFFIAVIQAEDLVELAHIVEQTMRKEFGCDAATVVLFNSAASLQPPLLNITKSSDLALFEDFRKRRETICGRIKQNKLTLLFQQRAETTKSVALVALGLKSASGALALGSNDENKFFPGMGTLFLDMMGQMLSQCIARLHVEPQPDLQQSQLQIALPDHGDD